MRLWLLEMTEKGANSSPDYDVVCSIVICAYNEVAARDTAQANGGDETGRFDLKKTQFWTDPELATCRQIGVVISDEKNVPAVELNSVACKDFFNA